MGRRELAPGGISRIVPGAPWPRWILSQLLEVERSVQTILMVWASSLVLSKQSNSSQWDPSRLSNVTCTSSGEARTKKPKDASYISTFFVSLPRYHWGNHIRRSNQRQRREEKGKRRNPLTFGSSLPLSVPVPQVGSTLSVTLTSAVSFGGGCWKRYSSGTGRNSDFPLAGSQQNALVLSSLGKQLSPCP